MPATHSIIISIVLWVIRRRRIKVTVYVNVLVMQPHMTETFIKMCSLTGVEPDIANTRAQLEASPTLIWKECRLHLNYVHDVDTCYGAEAQQLRNASLWHNVRQQIQTVLFLLVKPVVGTPVILIWRPRQYLLSFMQLVFEVQLGFIIKVL